MGQRSFFSLRAAAAATLLVALHATGASAQGRVSGLVTDENSKPIKAATVTAQNNDINLQFTATTDDKGRFTLIGLRPGTWRFVAQAPGFFAEEGTANVRGTGQPNAPIGFSLKKTSVLAGALGGVSAKDLQSDLAAADTLFQQEKWNDAIAQYKAIATKAPTLGSINLQIAAAYFNKKDYDQALTSYEELLKVDADNERALVGVARSHLAKGETAAALQTLTGAVSSVTPGSGRDIFYALGDMKFDENAFDEAMSWYQKAADADPSWGKAWYKLALCAEKTGDTARAKSLFGKVLVVDPTSPEAAVAKTTLEQLSR